LLRTVALHRSVSEKNSVVVFALVGDVRLSSRALRQLRWLSDAGWRVEALSFGPPPAGPPVAPGVSLRVLDRPAGRGPAFFWRCHRLFASAAAGIPGAVFHASDLYTLPAMAAAARQHGARLAYDSRELYPHVDATAGRPWARLAWSALERRFISRCDEVFTVNGSIADRLAATYDIERPTVVHNVPPRQPGGGGGDLRARLAIPEGQAIVLYQGLLRAGRGLEVIVRAMEDVPGAALVLIGDGPQRDGIARLASASLGGRAHLLPFTPPDELAALTRSADVGLCILEPVSESVRLALPNKLFEYLAADVPVVASDMPEVARVVREFDVGLIVSSRDPARLAEAIRRALADGASRARWRANIPAVFEAFDPEEDRRRFLAVYERWQRPAS
jgi:glycogen synthase